MWSIPFLRPDPFRGYRADLNTIFARLTGEWNYHPAQGLQCEVPFELAEPYCAKMNALAGKTVASLKATHAISVLNPVAIDLAVITLDPNLLAETKLLEALATTEVVRDFQDIHKTWAARPSSALKISHFPFHIPK